MKRLSRAKAAAQWIEKKKTVQNSVPLPTFPEGFQRFFVGIRF